MKKLITGGVMANMISSMSIKLVVLSCCISHFARSQALEQLVSIKPYDYGDNTPAELAKIVSDDDRVTVSTYNKNNKKIQTKKITEHSAGIEGYDFISPGTLGIKIFEKNPMPCNSDKVYYIIIIHDGAISIAGKFKLYSGCQSIKLKKGLPEVDDNQEKLIKYVNLRLLSEQFVEIEDIDNKIVKIKFDSQKRLYYTNKNSDEYFIRLHGQVWRYRNRDWIEE